MCVCIYIYSYIYIVCVCVSVCVYKTMNLLEANEVLILLICILL